MCTDFGPDRMRFDGLIPERVKKSQYNRLSANNNAITHPVSQIPGYATARYVMHPGSPIPGLVTYGKFNIQLQRYVVFSFHLLHLLFNSFVSCFRSDGGMELWKDAIKEFLPPCCYKFATDIRTCVNAVAAELKPSYMFDLAFVSSQQITAWLKRLHDVHLVKCRLTVIAVEQQIFIVNRRVIKYRMDDITRGNERIMIVDVSPDLQQPQSTSTALHETIVQYTAQVVETLSL